jgi:hypothetical protein
MTSKKPVLMKPRALTDNSNMLRGTINLSAAELHKFAPQYTGHTQIFMKTNIKYLEEMTGPNATIARQHAMNLRNLIEYCSLSYSGTPDLDTEEGNIEMGGLQLPVPTKTGYTGNSFSIRILEQFTEPLRHAVEFYRSGLMDPYGDFSHMHGSKLTLTPENYTAEIVIVQLDPKYDYIQDISLWQAVSFKPVSRDNIDWTQGDINIVAPKDLQCSGRYIANAHSLESWVQAPLNRRLSFLKQSKELLL